MPKGLKKAAKNYKNRGRWDESFKDDLFSIPSKATRIRLWEELEEIPLHWVEFYSVEKQKKTGFFTLCLNHNYKTGEHEENGCPYCKAEYNRTSYWYGYCISRREQKNGNLQVRPIRLTPKTVSDVLKLTDVAYPDEEWPDGWDDEEGPDATDPKFGFDISVSVSKKNNKTEYKADFSGQIKPLTREEIQAFHDYVEATPYLALAKPCVESVEDAQKNVDRILGKTEKGDEEERPRKKRPTRNYDEIDDDDDEEEDRPRRPTKAPVRKKSALTADDDDDEIEDDEEEEEAPAPRKKAKARPRKRLPIDDDDDDEDDTPSRSYAEADDEDEPDDDDDDDFDDED